MSEDDFDEQLQHRIDEVLYYIWDPIGVSKWPAPREEYSTYANKVWSDVRAGKSKEHVSAYLSSVAKEQMELEPNKEHDDEVAELIFEWVKILSQ